jgi:hypothetical protein
MASNCHLQQQKNEMQENILGLQGHISGFFEVGSYEFKV